MQRTTDDRKEATRSTNGGEEYIRDVISTKNEVQVHYDSPPHGA